MNTFLELILPPVDDDQRDVLVHEDEDGEKEGGKEGTHDVPFITSIIHYHYH